MKRFHWLLILLILSTTSCSLGSPGSVCKHGACVSLNIEGPVQAGEPARYIIMAKADQDTEKMTVELTVAPGITISTVEKIPDHAEQGYQDKQMISWQLSAKKGQEYAFSGYVLLDKPTVSYGIFDYSLWALAGYPPNNPVTDMVHIYLDPEGKQVDDDKAKLILKTSFPLPTIPPEVAMMTETAFAQNNTPGRVSNTPTSPVPTSTSIQVDAYPAYPQPDNEAPTPVAYPYPGPTYTPTNPGDLLLSTQTPTITSTPVHTATPIPLAVSPLLAGVQFRTARGEYEIDATGFARLLPPKSKELLTPDGQFRVITENDEIYLEDISTQVRTNLTNSPGVPSVFCSWSVDGKWMFYQEGDDQTGTNPYRVSLASKKRQQLVDLPDSNAYFVSRWPNDPGLALVNIRPRSIKLDTMTLSFSGYLYLLHLNDLKLEQVSHQIGAIYPGFPPYHDGQSPDRFIWSEEGGTYVYIRGQGSQPFKLPPIVNMKVDEEVGVIAPVWSPDERWLAFQAFYKGQTGWVLIDLKNQTARLLHLYTHVGMGGHIDAPEFSPDSRWLIVSARADESDLDGDWLYSVKGDERVRLPGPFVIFQ